MVALIVSLLLFSAAAACNAVMDKLQFHYQKSVFFKLDYTFWNPEYSWSHARFLPFTKYKVDAWHLFKSAMIVLAATSAVVLLSGVRPLPAWYWYPILLGCYGVVWNATFNLFFNHLLVRKP